MNAPATPTDDVLELGAEMREDAPPEHTKIFDSEEKAPSAFKTISEVAESLDVPQHVLRFWESRFPQIKPTKLRGGRRYYRPQDIEVLTIIKELLYKKGYTIKGAKKAFSQAMHPKPEVRMPEPVKVPMPVAAVTKPKLSTDEKKFSQLAVIRQELISLRDVLKPYVF